MSKFRPVKWFTKGLAPNRNITELFTAANLKICKEDCCGVAVGTINDLFIALNDGFTVFVPGLDRGVDHIIYEARMVDGKITFRGGKNLKTQDWVS